MMKTSQPFELSLIAGALQSAPRDAMTQIIGSLIGTSYDFENVMTTKRNNRGLFFQQTVFAIFGIMSLFSGQISAQQPAILGATDSSNQVVVFPDANTRGTQNLVPGLPSGAR